MASSLIAESTHRCARARFATQPRRIGSSGFTLLEMMVAIVILGMVLAMLTSAFSTVAHSKQQAENTLYTDREGRAILWGLTNELSSAAMTRLLPSRVELIGEAQSANGLPLDSISLSTFDARRWTSFDGFGSEVIVSYTCVPNPNHPGWSMLTRSQISALIPGNAGVAAPQPVVLADNLLSLHIRYFNGTNWTENWDSRKLAPLSALPEAVSIDLKMAKPSGHAMEFSTVVDVPIAITQW